MYITMGTCNMDSDSEQPTSRLPSRCLERRESSWIMYAGTFCCGVHLSGSVDPPPTPRNMFIKGASRSVPTQLWGPAPEPAEKSCHFTENETRMQACLYSPCVVYYGDTASSEVSLKASKLTKSLCNKLVPSQKRSA